VNSLHRAITVAVAAGIATVAGVARHAGAAPPTPERVLELCAQVDGPAHCGRLVEAEQLKTLPNLAVRDGDALRVSLFPSGTREFVDVTAVTGGRTFALWDYWSPINAVLLFTTDGERLGYALLQRTTGQLTVLPAEPMLAPDRQRIAIADFCASGCNNDLSVWRVTRDGVRRELAWKPGAAWTDVNVTWKDSDVLLVQYSLPGEDVPRKLERKLADPGWQRFQ
jgi:hypothetical protein